MFFSTKSRDVLHYFYSTLIKTWSDDSVVYKTPLSKLFTCVYVLQTAIKLCKWQFDKSSLTDYDDGSPYNTVSIVNNI